MLELGPDYFYRVPLLPPLLFSLLVPLLLPLVLPLLISVVFTPLCLHCVRLLSVPTGAPAASTVVPTAATITVPTSEMKYGH